MSAMRDTTGLSWRRAAKSLLSCPATTTTLNTIRYHRCRSCYCYYYYWMRPPGQPHTTWMKNIHDDLPLLDLGIHEARDLAQNRPLCRLLSLHSATHSYWCMLLLVWIELSEESRSGREGHPSTTVSLESRHSRNNSYQQDQLSLIQQNSSTWKQQA